ncbi:AMP-binding protein [Actinomadura xylanilytica]|uniref:AMP-binding protein n=1 Tax=Actinomadura xylanilytica TaxID=887459 RepID=UPI00255B40AA|nr:AMP-binding protein [Actinomadura xylanilytica]MDL4772769.1 AMP-binding protein [Actinomadura xylanilytica]
MPRFDLATLHEAIAAEIPDRECVVWRDRRLTWRQVTERSRRLAHLLHGHGLGRRAETAAPWESPHDHLALYLHNGPEYLEGLLGAHKARMAPFNVNYRYVDGELAHLFADARPRAIVYHARFAATIGRVAPALDRPLLLQVADESGAALLPGALDYEAALATASAAPLDAVRPDAGDLHILYTGGTTGLPKGVLWRIGDLVLGPLGLRRRDGTPFGSLREVVEKAAAGARHKVLVGPPLMHGAGTWSALGGWCGGACVVFPDRVDGLDAADLLATAERERVTRIPLVGDAFARPLLERLEAVPHDLGALRSMVNSAAGISPDVQRRLNDLLPHVRITDVLGSSETGFQVLRQAPAARGPLPGSYAPAAGAAVLSADRARRLAPGEDELGWLAKAGSIPLGYLGDPGRTADTFRTVDGERLVVAGDRARLLADGTIEVHGREATTINTGGEKVFAEEVETVLRDLPGIADALVVGRPSERWGTEIVAVLRTAAPDPSTPGPSDPGPSDEELRAGCAARLARYKIPKTFLRTADGLRLPNGKPDYAAARALSHAPSEPN